MPSSRINDFAGDLVAKGEWGNKRHLAGTRIQHVEVGVTQPGGKDAYESHALTYNRLGHITDASRTSPRFHPKRFHSSPLHDPYPLRILPARTPPKFPKDAPSEGKTAQRSLDIADQPERRARNESEERFTDKKFIQKLRQALSELPDPDLAERIVKLQFVHGFTPDEVSAQLRITAETTRQVTAAANEKLREIFSRPDDEDEASAGGAPTPHPAAHPEEGTLDSAVSVVDVGAEAGESG